MEGNEVMEVKRDNKEAEWSKGKETKENGVRIDGKEVKKEI